MESLIWQDTEQIEIKETRSKPENKISRYLRQIRKGSLDPVQQQNIANDKLVI
jgi:hypothetical protein